MRPIPRNSYTSRRWTENEDYELIEGLRAGLPCRSIADNINRAGIVTRTVCAIKHRALARFGGIQEIRSGEEAQRTISAVRNASQIAILLGMPYRLVKKLCETKVRNEFGKEEKMLANSRTGYTQPKRRGKPWKYLITDDSLMKFLDNQAFWMLIDTALIADRDWQAYALLAREDVDGAWIPATAFAAQLGYDPNEGRRWVRRGKLPATKVLGAWYLWSGDEHVKTFMQNRALTPL